MAENDAETLAAMPPGFEYETTEYGGTIYSALPRDSFFAIKRAQAVDLAFPDVRVATAPHNITEFDVDLTSRFSRNHELKVPFVTAAMDTITEARMAIAVEMLGGLGVLHARLSTEATKEQVRRIKYALTQAENPNPRTVTPDRTLENILQECDEFGWTFRSFPVIDNNGRVIGVLSGKAFKYKRFMLGDTTAEQAMVPFEEMAHGGPGMTVNEAYEIMEEREIGAVPLINPDRSLSGMYSWADIERIKSGDAKKFSVDSRGRLLVAMAIKTRESELERIRIANGDDDFVDIIVVDTSQGDGKHAAPIIRMLKEEYPNKDVVGGNVDEPEGSIKLLKAGVDAIKVGKGPGSICTTRLEIGIGCPQVTAVYNCVEALKGTGVPVCADGGIANNGDLTVAIAAGADTIMMGGMFAATEETPGQFFRDEDGVLKKVYRGMGSEDALLEDDNEASLDRYEYERATVILPQGITRKVPTKGPVGDIFEKAALALREGMASSNSRTIAEHHRARFRFHTDAGAQESRPHDVN